MVSCPECGEPPEDEPHIEHALYDNTFVCRNLHRWPCDCEARRDARRLDVDAPTKEGKDRGKRYRHGGRKGSRERTDLGT